MRKLLGGKNILLILFIISLFSSFFVTNSSNSAFAGPWDSDSITYTKSMCEEMGFEWEDGWFLKGCKVKFLKKEDGKYKQTGDYGSGGNREAGNGGMHKYAAYIQKDTDKPCVSGFKSETIKIDDYAEKKACVKTDGLEDKEYGLPPSLTNADGKDKRVKLDENNCKNYGGEFTYTTINGRARQKKCVFRKEDGSEVFHDYDTDLPDTFYTYSKDHKCPSGYKEEHETVGNTTAAKCTKLVTNSNGEQVPANDPSVTGKTEDSAGKKDPKKDCDVDLALNWWMCPALSTGAEMASKLYGFVAEHFLKVNSADLFKNGDDTTYNAWQSFRDIGNVIFIIAIMAIVISQITGYGISNYGIKKMLPKILVMAILINLSWYVAVIGVDISNILGKNIFKLFLDISVTAEQIGGKTGFDKLVSDVATFLAAGAGLATVVAGAGGILAALAVAVFGIFSFVVILLVRQAIVILCVVASPIAIAAIVLPNTEGFFKKWFSIYKSMIFIYPMASIIMGAAILASTVLRNTQGIGDLEKILFTLIPAMALIGTVKIIKTTLHALGSIGNKISGVLNKGSEITANKARESDANKFVNRKLKSGLSPLRHASIPLGKGRRLHFNSHTRAIAEKARQDAHDAKHLNYTNESIVKAYGDKEDLSSAQAASLRSAQAGLNKAANDNIKNLATIYSHDIDEIRKGRFTNLDDRETYDKLLNSGDIVGAEKFKESVIVKYVQEAMTTGETRDHGKALMTALYETDGIKPESIISSSLSTLSNEQLSKDKLQIMAQGMSTTAYIGKLGQKDDTAESMLKLHAFGNGNGHTYQSVAQSEATHSGLTTDKLLSQNKDSLTNTSQFVASNFNNKDNLTSQASAKEIAKMAADILNSPQKMASLGGDERKILMDIASHNSTTSDGNKEFSPQVDQSNKGTASGSTSPAVAVISSDEAKLMAKKISKEVEFGKLTDSQKELIKLANNNDANNNIADNQLVNAATRVHLEQQAKDMANYQKNQVDNLHKAVQSGQYNSLLNKEYSTLDNREKIIVDAIRQVKK